MIKQLKSTGKLLLKAAQKWDNDNVNWMSAALAYNMLFSFMPLLIILIAVAGSLFGQNAIRGEVEAQIELWVGKKAAKVIQVLLENTAEYSSGFFTKIFGGLIFVYGASNVFMQLQETLNEIWGVEFMRKNWLVTHLLKRGISVLIIAGIGFFMGLTLILDAFVAGFGGYVSELFTHEIYFILIQAGSFLFSFLIVSGMFAVIYRTIPRADVAWQDVWSGALVAAFLFKIGNTVISLYLANSIVVSAFGAAGSVIAILFWFYFVAQILFYGAEVTYVYSQSHGSQS